MAELSYDETGAIITPETKDTDDCRGLTVPLAEVNRYLAYAQPRLRFGLDLFEGLTLAAATIVGDVKRAVVIIEIVKEDEA